MKILVTGGAGFIGSHIADAYQAQGHTVEVLDNMSTGKPENVPAGRILHAVDIRSEEAARIIADGGYDVVNHHAAQMNVRRSVADPTFDADVNIVGSINVFEAAKKGGVKKVIFASSGGAVYGEQHYFPADEQHPIAPCSPYGISKRAAELYLDYYKMIFGLDAAVMRYTNVYGPRQNPHGEAGVIAIFADSIIAGKPLTVNGSGLQTRDYVYVGDLARANVLALRPEVVGPLNVCTGVESTVLDVVAALAASFGTTPEVVHAEAKAGEQFRSVCSFDKLHTLTGWTPEVTLAEGLVHTTRWYQTQS